MKRSKSTKAGLVSLLFCLLAFVTPVIGQVPPVTGIQCVACKGMNGEHAVTCLYYNKPSSDPIQSTTLPTLQDKQPQDLIFDVLFQLNNQIDTWIEKEEAKQAAINKARQINRQNIQDSIATINHQSTKEKLKGLPQQSSNNDNIRYLQVRQCKETGNGFEIYKNGTWKTLQNCSELENYGLSDNDTIICKKGSELYLRDDFSHHNIVIKENSRVSYSPMKQLLILTKGMFWAVIRGDIKRAKAYQRQIDVDVFNVRTPAAVLGVRGTTFKVCVTEDNRTEVFLIEGELEIETISKAEKVILTSGKKIVITADGKIDTITALDVETLKQLINELSN